MLIQCFPSFLDLLVRKSLVEKNQELGAFFIKLSCKPHLFFLFFSPSQFLKCVLMQILLVGFKEVLFDPEKDYVEGIMMKESQLSSIMLDLLCSADGEICWFLWLMVLMTFFSDLG